MTRKQSTERLWPPEEKAPFVKQTVSVEEEAQFSLDAQAVAKALAPVLKSSCPTCPTCPTCPDGKKERIYGHVNIRESILLIVIAVLALSTLLCALISMSIASKSSRAIIKLESLLLNI